MSLATSEFCVQVSDRKVVTLPDYRPHDDLAIKSVAYFHSMVWGYSGLATVQGTRTDVWMSQQLRFARDASPESAAVCLREAANRDIGSVRVRQTFVGVGWGRMEDSGPPIPCTAIVSNHYSGATNILTHTLPSFSALIDLQPDPRHIVMVTTGVRLTKPENVRVTRGLRRIFEHGAGQRAVMQWLASEIRSVSDRVPHLVGRDLLATCIPVDPVRDNQPRQAFIIKGAPRKGEASFHDLRDSGPMGADGYPHIVGPRYIVSLHRITATPVPPQAPEPPPEAGS